jgi:hypothetical protein
MLPPAIGGHGPALYQTLTNGTEQVRSCLPEIMDTAADQRRADGHSAAAQVQLMPGTRNTHPKSGAAGDFYLDSTARLWFCKGGTTWHLIA